MMEHVGCVVCGSEDFKLRYSFGGFQLVECTQCSLVYVSPRLPDQDVFRLYIKDYFESPNPAKVGYNRYFSNHKAYLRTFKKRFNVIDGLDVGEKMLFDVGAGAGYFLNVAQERGWSASGIEISPNAVEYGSTRLGVKDLSCGNFTNGYDGGEQGGGYSVITMWDYIEHSVNPNVDLRKAHDMLADGGYLVLETQDIGSLVARVMGGRWWHLVKYREHLYHFNHKTISLILEKNGFSVDSITRRDAGKYINSDVIVERSCLFGETIQSLAKLILGVFKSGDFYFNPRDEMIVVARKTDIPKEHT